MFYLVYKINNKTNGKYYIGCHKTKDKNDGYMGSGKVLKRAIQKYGIENFTKEILFECGSLEEMFSKEKELVTISEDSYNVNNGGRGGFGYINLNALNNIPIRGLAIKGKNGGGFQGKRHTKEAKFRMSNSHKGKAPFAGKKHTEKTKEKMRKRASERIGTKCSQYGTHWITNGTENKKIKKDEIVPNGWKLGRIF